MVRVAIIGASGYTGAESIEIILRHSQAEVVYLSALPEECGTVAEVFPQFKGLLRHARKGCLFRNLTPAKHRVVNRGDIIERLILG